jgi:hypothetical protein
MKRVIAYVAAVSLLLASCQQIFTTSVAGFMARDKLELPATISSDQALAAAEQALGSGDTAAALAVLDRINGLVSTLNDPATVSELKTTAASLAIAASGVDQALVSVLELMGSSEPPSIEAITEIVASIATPEAAIAALSYLADADVESSPDQKILAAVVLVVAATEGDLSQLENPDPENQTLNTALALAGAGVNELIASGDTSMLGLVSPIISFLPQP